MEQDIKTQEDKTPFAPRRTRGYYLRTAGFAFLCVLIIFLQRWEKATMVPIVFTIAGITYSTSDFFMILAAGIGGYAYGIGAFFLLFLSEIAVPRSSNGIGLFSMVIYLILVLMTGYYTRTRWFSSWKRSLMALLSYILILGSSLQALMLYLRSISFETDYTKMTLAQMYLGVMPELFLAVLVLYLFYQYAPDSLKMGIGEGYRYTKEYKEKETDILLREHSVLAHRVTIFVVSISILLSFFAVMVFNLTLQGIMSDQMPKGLDLIGMDIQMILLIFCVTLPIGIGMNAVVLRTLVKPLNEMSGVMKQYFSTGEEGRRQSEEILGQLDIRTGDEIQSLYQSLCLMVSDMSGYIDAIQREMELKQDLAEAEAESKAKSSFLSSMSHEIRTPINAVLGMDEMILRESGEEEILEYAENIRTAGNSLLGLINDILDFSKIEAGKMDIIPVEYGFASVFNDLVNMIKQRAEAKGLKLVVDADAQIPGLLYGDEIRFKQIVTNILTNAVKYTEKGTVTLLARAEKIDDDHIDLFVSVQDTGIGIKQEDIKKLFSAFERIEEKRNRNVEGTGLGMNITKQLLAMMDSKLEVESVYGEGSVFSFHLKQKVVDWEPIGDFEEALKRSFANRKKYRESFSAPEARVLVVDDTPMNLTVFKGLLKRTRVQIDTAENGMECLSLMSKNTYDIIFLDHRMPEMDGIETKERMETLEGNKSPEVPVIALTANAVSGAREEYLNHGFTDYLTKPIDTSALEQMMVKYLPEEKVTIQTEEIREASGSADSRTKDTRKAAEGAAARTMAENPASADGTQNSLSDPDGGLPVIDGLDWNYAKLHLPDIEVLKTVLEEFYQVIGRQADQLDAFYQKLSEKEALDGYRIQVHGMKSSAATVGIVPLAGMAKLLEFAAKDGNTGLIRLLHQPFVDEWRSYREKMRDLFETDEEGTKEPFAPEAVQALLGDISDGMEDFDIDTADRAVKELEKYQYPEPLGELIGQLKIAVTDMEDEEAAELIEKITAQIRETKSGADGGRIS